ncbi:MarR family winged helix-turn-helix transcriptional regulator [Nocardia sp. NPDC051570]|uniref:MarR family winged helix-turn-helix transcriptional regulator n=1 Tax=Nocardia sp. NPDC051570 TaxID=3364324 RepID=UPI00379BF7E6
MSDAVDRMVAAWGQVDPDLDIWPTQVFERLKRLGRLLDREMKDFFAPYGLESWEFEVLATLRRSGDTDGLTAGALIKAALVTSGAITHRIDRLAAKGLVRRAADPADRRTIRIQLTDEGRELVDTLMPARIADQIRILGGVDRPDLDRLNGLLRGLLESLGDTDPD